MGVCEMSKDNNYANLNQCNNYKIPCQFALTAWSELPCFGSQVQCDAWREEYKKEFPEEYKNGTEERRKELSDLTK
jgi:hypothetical protein